MKIHVSLLLATLLLIASTGYSIHSQPITNPSLSQVIAPPARGSPGLVYDPINERVMLFGGFQPNTASEERKMFDDSWAFDCGTGNWTELHYDESPSPRNSPVMVYDSTNEVILLFGGFNGTDQITDTWIFDCHSQNWTQVHPDLTPTGLAKPAMVYDDVNQRVLLLTGYGTNTPEDSDTWEYDYSTNHWMMRNPETTPITRTGASFVFDSLNESMIIFGGKSDGLGESYMNFDDTWKYNYNNDTWIEMSPTTHPPKVRWSGSVYDSSNHKMILFGGKEENSVSDLTWIYDSYTNEWEERETSVTPRARYDFGFAYDSINKKAILFGGSPSLDGILNDTWCYDYETNTWEELAKALETSTEPPPEPPFLIFIAIPILSGGILIIYSILRRRASR